MKRYLFLVLLAFTSVAVDAGIYQRTRYTHILVWNDQPTSFQEVTWTGEKDEKGYATGSGTVTWFAPEKPPTTGSVLPSRRKMIVVRSATGTMERGKLVTAPKGGKPRSQARGQRAEGTPAPESSPEQSRERESASTPAKESPSPTPSPSATPTSSASAPSPTPSPSPRDESINSLTRPPSSLQLNPPHPTESASPSP